MKLLSLEITAFGGVRDRVITPKDGLCEILDRNGSGKSTVAAFIKVMLFGLDGARRDALTENEYALYEPWQGGRFGGALVFLHEGHTYRLERFYERTGRALTPRGTLRVLDGETGEETDRFGTEPGRALLGVDGESFVRTAYLSSRGILASKTNAITAKLGGIESEEADLAAYHRADRLLKDKRNEIRTEVKQKNGTKLLDLAERELRNLEARLDEAHAAARAAEEKERERAAAEAEWHALAASCEALGREHDRLSERRERRRVYLEERERLLAADRAAGEQEAALAALFPAGLSVDTDLAELGAMQKRCRELLSLGTEAGQSEPPTDAELTRARTALRERAATEAALLSCPPEHKKAGSRLVSLLILSALIFLAGLLLGLWLTPFLFPLSALGVALTFGALLSQRRLRSLKEARLRAEAAHTAALAEAEAALMSLGLDASADEAALDGCLARTLAARAERVAAEGRRAELAHLEEALTARLLVYPGAHGEAEAAIATLSHTYGRLMDTKRARGELATALAELDTRMPPPEKEGEDRAEELALLRHRCEEAKATMHLAAEGAGQFRALADTAEGLRTERDALCERIEGYRRRLAVLDRTRELLATAREELEARCLGGIRRGLARYTDRLLGGRLREPQVALDFSLSFLEGGERRSAEYLSTGLRAILDICIRLALLDELYPEDPPPLVLDDPFLALDEDNLTLALSLLAELAKERQILYLTCHPSRSAAGQQP